MTGRGAGWCAGYDAPGYANPQPGQGLGRGRGGKGRGQGRGRGPGGGRWGNAGQQWVPDGPTGPAQLAPVDELTALQQQQQTLKTQLNRIEERLDALSTTPKQE